MIFYIRTWIHQYTYIYLYVRIDTNSLAIFCALNIFRVFQNISFYSGTLSCRERIHGKKMDRIRSAWNGCGRTWKIKWGERDKNKINCSEWPCLFSIDSSFLYYCYTVFTYRPYERVPFTWIYVRLLHRFIGAEVCVCDQLWIRWVRLRN